MNIIVLIKQVPDTSIELKVNAENADILHKDIPWVINPYDEYAVEEALRIKENHGGKVTVISMGPERAVDIIKNSIAMGVDEAILVKDVVFEGSDAYSTAAILSKAVAICGYDIILTGKQAVDDGLGQVGHTLAEILNIPSVSSILKLVISADKKTATVHREIDEGLEIIELPIPALFTIQQGINKPRYASLPGIMRAKKKEIKILDAGSLGISPQEAGQAASRTITKKLFKPPARKKGKMLSGDTNTAAKELLSLLKNEAKVI